MSNEKLICLLFSCVIGLLTASSGFAVERLEIIGDVYNESVLLAADEVLVADAVFHQDVTIEGDVTIERCLFVGRLFLNSWGTFDVSYSIFEDGVEVGGNVREGRMVNNTMAGSAGSGIELRNYQSLALVNNIVAFNRVGISDHWNGVAINWCDVFENRENYYQCGPGAGGISEDPLFRDRAGKDWRLTANSPCVDAGDPNRIDSDSSCSDIGALPLLRDEALPRFSLLSPADQSVIPDTLVTFTWEPVRYARLYRLLLYYVTGDGDVISSGEDTLISPLNAIDVNLDDYASDLGPVVLVHWLVEAITFSDTIQARSGFVFGRPLSVSQESPLTPYALSLSAFPNPFNSSTTISYTLPRSGWTTMDVMDLNGRVVTRLSDGWKEAGSYREVWDGRGTAGGLFYLRCEVGGQTQVRPLICLK